MLEFFLKYPWAVYRKGEFAFLAGWPLWMLVASAAAAAAGLAAWLRWGRVAYLDRLGYRRLAIVWALQTAVVVFLLLLLWRPALFVPVLKSKQNVIAVVVDDSSSMSVVEGGSSRLARARAILEGGLLDQLKQDYQVRLYRVGRKLERLESVDQLTASQPATRLAEGLRAVAMEAQSLPVGAVVLLSDGADNTGGIDLETLAALRARKLPVHTIGFGETRFHEDLELVRVEMPPRSLPDAKVEARVTFRQEGFAGQQAIVKLQVGGRVVASQVVKLDRRPEQTVSLIFDAGTAGSRQFDVVLEPLPGERNARNNVLAGVLQVEDRKPRLLYMEGEPRWEYKFLRRALEEDRVLHLVSILRTTQNKIYRQGIESPEELNEGFPRRVEELFRFEGVILGSVEASYFTATQLELLREFVDRRGGGLLLLGGRAGLGDGGWGASPLAGLLPAELPKSKPSFHRDHASVRLTPEGGRSLITRLLPDAAQNQSRWSQMPKLADYQELGNPKPGAIVLLESVAPTGRVFPLLVVQQYGHGRVGILATGGTWRWQMQQPVEDRTHELFWQQLARWLVAATPRQVSASSRAAVLFDGDAAELHAQVRDASYQPVTDAVVEARVMAPSGAESRIEFQPVPEQPGLYRASWQPPVPGLYLAEVTARRGEQILGQDQVPFLRQDGVAESFHIEQNRELLERLAQETGGRYYEPGEANELLKEIAFSEAGFSVREVRELWNLPAVFFCLLLVKSAEWYLRRRWGCV